MRGSVGAACATVASTASCSSLVERSGLAGGAADDEARDAGGREPLDQRGEGRMVDGAVAKRRHERDPEAREIRGGGRADAREFPSGIDRWKKPPSDARTQKTASAGALQFRRSSDDGTEAPVRRARVFWLCRPGACRPMLRAKQGGGAGRGKASRQSIAVPQSGHERPPRFHSNSRFRPRRRDRRAARRRHARRRGLQLHRHRARPQRRRRRGLDGARALPGHDREGDRGDDRRGASPLRHPRRARDPPRRPACSRSTRS